MKKGWGNGAMAFDCHWKGMESWTKCFVATIMCLLFIKSSKEVFNLWEGCGILQTRPLWSTDRISIL